MIKKRHARARPYGFAETYMIACTEKKKRIAHLKILVAGGTGLSTSNTKKTGTHQPKSETFS